MERYSSTPDIDIELPSLARMFDYVLGGSNNFAVDRSLVAQMAQLMPDIMAHAHAHRASLRRVVGFCVDAGIRQFLSLGSSIPIRGHVGDLVQQAALEARVVYVDTEPVALGISHKVHTGNDRTAAIQANLRQPETILTNPQVRGLLDFDQPMAVIFSTLHAVREDPARLVAAFRDAVASGSYLMVTHVAAETRPEEMAGFLQMWQRGGIAVRPRSRAEVERLFAGLELVEPGLVWAHEWRPDRPHSQDNDLDRPIFLSGVGRKP